MPLPYSHKQVVDIQDETLLFSNSSQTLNLIKAKLSEIETDNLEFNGNTLNFNYKNSLFKIAYDFSVEVKGESGDKKVVSIISLDNLLKFSIAAAILPAFFTFLDFGKFLVYSPIFFVSFFFLNLFFVNSFLKSTINKAIGINEFDFNGSEQLSEGQKKWENDPDICSACGEELLEIDLSCPECGINLKRNRFSVPLDVTKYQAQTIRYYYKDAEK